MSTDLQHSEEEILVYVDFKDNVDIENFKSIHVLGAESSSPVVQMDDMFFTGKYENPLGTYMFFEDNPNPECTDPLFDKMPNRNLKYLCKTRKCLAVEHSFVTPKEGTDPNHPNQAENIEEIESVNFKNTKDAIDKFKEYFNITSTDTSNNDKSEKMDIDS